MPPPNVAFWIFLGVSLATLAATHGFLKTWARTEGLGWKPVAMVALLLVAGWLLSTERSMETKAGIMRSVSGMAPTYAIGMKDRDLETITEDTPPDDPTYLDLIHAQRYWLEANSAIADVYIIAKNKKGQNILLVDSETDYNHNGIIDDEREQRTAIGEVYGEDADEIAQCFAGQSFFTDTIVTDRWGSWVSAYEPIRRDDGTVFAILGIDYPAERWTAAINLAVWGALAQVGMGIILVIAGSAFMSVWRAAISRERAESQRTEKLHAQAEERAKAKAEFLAQVTHELRTPMSAIQGYAELLADQDYPASERAAALRTIQIQSEHLLALVGDVLDLSKVEAGRMTVQSGECAIIDVAEEVVQALRVRATEKGLRLAVDVQYPVPATIVADRMRLRQVLLNLVSNAVKFTDAGGVTVRISYSQPACELAIEVIDTGVGMTEAQISRLFVPYVQASEMTSSVYGGTGLGLVISKKLVELMGGRVSLASRANHGTRATVTFPTPAEPRLIHASRPLQIVQPLAPTPPVTSLQGRILIAEDSPDIQRLVAFILKKAGATIDFATDGHAALSKTLDAAASNEPFDLVLLDMDLPGLDGIQVVKALRAKGYSGSITALTARSQEGDREACLAAGCDDYITKPVDRATFLSRCAEGMKKRSAKAA